MRKQSWFFNKKSLRFALLKRRERLLSSLFCKPIFLYYFQGFEPVVFRFSMWYTEAKVNVYPQSTPDLEGGMYESNLYSA